MRALRGALSLARRRAVDFVDAGGVEDAAILLGVMSGHDPKDSTSLNVPVEVEHGIERWANAEIIDIVQGPGKGALLFSERDVIEKSSGALLCTLTSTTFIRGEGGFGGGHGYGDQDNVGTRDGQQGRRRFHVNHAHLAGPLRGGG